MNINIETLINTDNIVNLITKMVLLKPFHFIFFTRNIKEYRGTVSVQRRVESSSVLTIFGIIVCV